MPSPTLGRQHLVLLGLRASGKSTIGAQVAARLGVPFVDLDVRTAARLHGATVKEAFVSAGEPAFRAAEAAELLRALDEPPQVIALGGGTPTAPGAAASLRQAQSDGRAFLVFLDPPLSVLADRLGLDAGDRPSLTGAGVVAEIEEVARTRRPLYAALADLRFLEPLPTEALVSIITSQVGSDADSAGAGPDALAP